MRAERAFQADFGNRASSSRISRTHIDLVTQNLNLYFPASRAARLMGARQAVVQSCQFVVAGVIQLVECQLPKLDVAGSSPVARSLRHFSSTYT